MSLRSRISTIEKYLVLALFLLPLGSPFALASESCKALFANNTNSLVAAVLRTKTNDPQRENKFHEIPDKHTPFAYGRLKFLSSRELAEAIRLGQMFPGYILIIEKLHPSGEVPLANAIIVSHNIPRGSHAEIQYSALNRLLGYFDGAFASPILRRFENNTTPVAIVSREDTKEWSISRQPEDVEMARQYENAHRINMSPLQRPGSTGEMAVVSGHRADAHSINQVGTKFYFLNRIRRNPETKHLVPEVFALTSRAYFDFMQQAGLGERIEQKFSRIRKLIDNLEENQPQVLREFAEIQNLISSAQIPQPILEKVYSSIQANIGLGAEVRFRSNSPLEDYLGAGIYESTARKINTLKDVEAALLEVWGSTHTFRAYLVREYFGLDHQLVAMPILIHRSIRREAYNGIVPELTYKGAGIYQGQIIGVPGARERVTSLSGKSTFYMEGKGTKDKFKLTGSHEPGAIPQIAFKQLFKSLIQIQKQMGIFNLGFEWILVQRGTKLEPVILQVKENITLEHLRARAENRELRIPQNGIAKVDVKHRRLHEKIKSWYTQGLLRLKQTIPELEEVLKIQVSTNFVNKLLLDETIGYIADSSKSKISSMKVIVVEFRGVQLMFQLPSTIFHGDAFVFLLDHFREVTGEEPRLIDRGYLEIRNLDEKDGLVSYELEYESIDFSSSAPEVTGFQRAVQILPDRDTSIHITLDIFNSL